MGTPGFEGKLRRTLLFGIAAAVSFPFSASAQVETRSKDTPGDPRAALVSPGRAPFGSAINQQRIPNYDRATDLIGTSGPLTREGVMEAKRVGFVSILDLQPAADQSRSERLIAEYAHLKYFNLPIPSGVPNSEQVQQFASIVNNRQNLPILVHGANVDQVGAVWALYRASQGVPADIAVVDGLTAGLGSSLPAVRAALGLPSQ